MPEQLTKHPDVTLQVLRSGGARCGAGDAPQILTACPAERFCRLPGGEICVYGVEDAAAMTQWKAGDWAALATVVGSAGHAMAATDDAGPAWGGLAPWIGPAIALVLGLLIGAILARWRGGRGR